MTTEPEQLSFGSEYYVPPPACYKDIVEAMREAFWEEYNPDELTPEELADDMDDGFGAFELYKRQDIERSIRIYRERRVNGLA